MKRYLLLCLLIVSTTASSQIYLKSQLVSTRLLPDAIVSLSWADIAGSPAADLLIYDENTYDPDSYPYSIGVAIVATFRDTYLNADANSDMTGDYEVTMSCRFPKRTTVTKTIRGKLAAVYQRPVITFDELIGFSSCYSKMIIKGASVTGSVTFRGANPGVWGGDGQPVLRTYTLTGFMTGSNNNPTYERAFTKPDSATYAAVSGFSSGTSYVLIDDTLVGETVRVDVPVTMLDVNETAWNRNRSFDLVYTNSSAAEARGCEVSVGGQTVSTRPVPVSVALPSTGVNQTMLGEYRVLVPVELTCNSAGRKIMNLLMTYRPT